MVDYGHLSVDFVAIWMQVDFTHSVVTEMMADFEGIIDEGNTDEAIFVLTNLDELVDPSKVHLVFFQ